jgi:hypothetical protein
VRLQASFVTPAISSFFFSKFQRTLPSLLDELDFSPEEQSANDLF